MAGGCRIVANQRALLHFDPRPHLLFVGPCLVLSFTRILLKRSFLGEIHSDWRDVVSQGVRNAKLPVRLTSPNTVHEDSDDCGAIILGMEDQRPNWDRLGAKMNQIRTQTLLQKADVVVVKFGDKYKQWNAAYDAGYAAALGKPLITLHPPSLSHMLKEVNASAHSVCEHPHQVVQTLAYVIRGDLPAIPKDGDLFVPIADRLGKGNPNP